MGMTTHETSKVLIIDDDQEEAIRVKKILEKASSGHILEFIVQTPEGIQDLSEYFLLINTLRASAVLIDQRLGVRSIANYTGLKLASILRSVLPMFPIFILTKWVQQDELEKQGYEVDDVMDKQEMISNPSTYLGRIIRAMGRYESAKTKQSKRMHELIAASLDRELNSEETHELVNIRAEIGLSTLGREIELAELTRTRLENKKDILDALKKLVNEG
jgi:CheY-like chemotaxis protein